MDWIDLDKAFVWHPFTQVQTESSPIPVEKAEGVWIYGTDGKKYLDANSSWWVNIHGHGHPALKRAIVEQADKLQHVIFAGLSHEPAARLSESLVKWAGKPFSKVFFSDNGSTAVEVALKMTFQYWFNKGLNKRIILALEGSYHGDTFGSMSVSERDVFNEPFVPFLFDVKYIPRPSEENFEEVMTLLRHYLTNEEVAGFIYEPLVQGAAGMKMYSPEHLSAILEKCRQCGLILIADEVMTGFGRTGKMFAGDYLDIKPDILCLSKGLTGGYLPMGVTLTHETIFNAFLSNEKRKGFLHGHSFTGNPIACALALASLELFDDQSVWDSIAAIEQAHQNYSHRFRQLSTHEIRVLGTILAIDLKVSESETGYFNPAYGKLYTYFIKKGLLVRPLGNTVFINPPYCIRNDELELIYSAIDELTETLFNR